MSSNRSKNNNNNNLPMDVNTVDDDIEQQQQSPMQQSPVKNLQPYIFIIDENSKLLPRHTTTSNNNNNYYATSSKDDDDTKSTGKESSTSSSNSSCYSPVIKKDDNNMDQPHSYVCYYYYLISLLKNCWKWYDNKLQTHPVVTKSITAAIIVCSGDFCGQSIEQQQHHVSFANEFDISRSFRFFLVGGLLQAPITHYYLGYLDYKLPPTPSPWTMITIYKLLIDQMVFAPIFTAIMFIFLDTLQGFSCEFQVKHIQNDYITTMIANWKLWIPAVFINFAFCPPKLRVLYNNIIFFVWSIFLSLLLNTTTAAATTTR